MRRGIRYGGLAAMTALVLALACPAPARAQEGVQRVPLGGSLAKQEGEKFFGVYVPTRFGGQLTIQSSSGTVESLTGPDGKARGNGSEVGDNAHGWYTFKVSGAEGPYTVTTSFVQVGQAARMPWNFYYWPTKSDVVHEPWSGGNGRVDTVQPLGDDVLVATPGSFIAPGQDIVRAGSNGLLETPPAAGDTSTWFPNLYDDLTWRGPDGQLYATPSPLLKYDQLFTSGARRWEASNAINQDIQRWPGHCLGGAVASISLNEPVPAPGSDFTADELKALWAELGENHLNHQIGDNASGVPAGPPRSGLDACDPFTSRVHNMFEKHIRAKRQSLLSNMRAFPPNGLPHEVWNQGIGKYTATYHAIPGRGERSVRLVVELVANAGANLNNQDPKPRQVTYEYTVVYGLNGEIDETKQNETDWIAVRGDALYAPLNILEVINTRWAGHNPYVTEANVRQLDAANSNGGLFRFASNTKPQWRSVYSYEGGPGSGPSFFAGGPGTGSPPNGMMAPGPRQGGFFTRVFGRR